ncbi:MAG TPA: DUF2934 domain-containing protein [Candidatus Polarisedimenticolia bacterium]
MGEARSGILKDRTKPTALTRPFIDSQALHRRISARAYDLFIKRGSRHGHDREDWLEAERLVHIEFEAEAVVPPGVRRPEGTPPSASRAPRDSTRSRN